MAGFLKYSGIRNSNCDISFLVVGPGDLCHKISEGLHQSAKNGRVIAVHQCETVADTLHPEIALGVDFIIFAFDSRTIQSLSEAESNIGQVDEHYLISGCACLVNCTSIQNLMGLTSYKVKQIREKYNLRFLSAKTNTPDGCASLGTRLINIAEAKLGLASGIPEVPFFLRYN